MKLIKKSVLIISLILFWTAAANSHPFYVSICQIDYNRQNSSLEISVKIFANDLLRALRANGAPEIFLGEEREDPKTDSYIFDYLKKNISLKVNGKDVNFRFIGKELETDVVWSYLEVDNIQELNSIDVTCTILVNTFDTQSNIIQVNNGKEIKNLLLNKRTTRGELVF